MDPRKIILIMVCIIFVFREEQRICGDFLRKWKKNEKKNPSQKIVKIAFSLTDFAENFKFLAGGIVKLWKILKNGKISARNDENRYFIFCPPFFGKKQKKIKKRKTKILCFSANHNSDPTNKTGATPLTLDYVFSYKTGLHSCPIPIRGPCFSVVCCGLLHHSS